MKTPTQQAILEDLAEICDFSPGIRFGQMLANLGYLTEDRLDQSLWDVEDDDLRAIVESHLNDMSSRTEQKTSQ